jgi:hypothetical protein
MRLAHGHCDGHLLQARQNMRGLGLRALMGRRRSGYLWFTLATLERKEGTACSFKFATTTSIKPSRR